LGLIVLIAKYKFNSFVALILASIFVGLCAGMKPTSMQKVFSMRRSHPGSIAAVVGLEQF